MLGKRVPLKGDSLEYNLAFAEDTLRLEGFNVDSSLVASLRMVAAGAADKRQILYNQIASLGITGFDDIADMSWGPDGYVYSGSDVMVNLPGFRSAHQLEQYEALAVGMAHLTVGRVRGKFDERHICAVHEHLFQDVYPWAGQLRTVDISKGGSDFCRHDTLHGVLAEFHDTVKKDRFLKGPFDKEDVADSLAAYFSILNDAHPFREGNGRTTRAILCMLAENAGYSLSFQGVSPLKWLDASRASAYGHDRSMAALLQDCLARLPRGLWRSLLYIDE